MKTCDTVPHWLEPIELEEWPTQIVESAELCYSLPIRAGWDTTPQINQMPMETEHTFRGLYPSECLSVNFMGRANPSADIRSWVEAIVSIVGFPIPSMVPESGLLRLMEWGYLGTCSPLSERLAVDETHLYQGLAMLPGTPPELARFYVLLARRGTSAWKISLSFMSACLPGMDEEMVISNDHVRAGATFGYLRLL